MITTTAKAVFKTYESLPEAKKQCVPGFNFTSDQLFWVDYIQPDILGSKFLTAFWVDIFMTIFSVKKIEMLLFNLTISSLATP